MGLYQTQSKEKTNREGLNICKLFNSQGIKPRIWMELKTFNSRKSNKQSILRWANDLTDISQRQVNGQTSQWKPRSTSPSQKLANQSYNEIPSHSSSNAYYKTKTASAGEDVAKGNSACTAARRVNLSWHQGEQGGGPSQLGEWAFPVTRLSHAWVEIQQKRSQCT